MKKKKLFWILAMITILAIGGGYYAFADRTTVSAASTYRVGQAKIGNVTKVVTATGTLQNTNVANLSFGTSGRLSYLQVKVGDSVKKGAVLAEIDKNVLLNQVQSAEANVKSAQAKLNSLQKGATASEIASLQAQVTRAQIDLDNAKRSLDTAKQNADSAYLDDQIRITAQELQQAQTNYDNINKTGDKLQISMAKTQLDQASKNYADAVSAKSNRTDAQTQLDNAQNAVRSAQASYDSALAQLQNSQQPADPSEIEQAQASLAQAQVSLSTAQMNLAQAQLASPFDGIVTAVSAHEGEQISGSTAVISVQSTEDGMQLQLPIDEADIGMIKIGQKATVTVDSLPGRKFEACVEQIAPTGTTQNNVTIFPVTLSFSGDLSELKVGQSMTANILIDQRTSVLTVPSEAVRGLNNKHTVLLYTSDSEQPKAAEVQIGLDDGMVTEIKSGLTEGQQIVIGTQTSAQNGQNRSANPFGAIGGGGNRGFGGAGGAGGGASRNR